MENDRLGTYAVVMFCDGAILHLTNEEGIRLLKLHQSKETFGELSSFKTAESMQVFFDIAAVDSVAFSTPLTRYQSAVRAQAAKELEDSLNAEMGFIKPWEQP